MIIEWNGWHEVEWNEVEWTHNIGFVETKWSETKRRELDFFNFIYYSIKTMLVNSAICIYYSLIFLGYIKEKILNI